MQPQFQLVIGSTGKRNTTGQHPVDVDWNALPDNAQEFVVRYGLKQYLADAMAGASGPEDAAAKVAARFAKLVSGDLSRTKGEGSDRPDSQESRAIKLAKAAIRDTLKAQNKTADKDAIADAAKKIASRFMAEAAKQLAAEATAKESAVNDLGDDILAALGMDDEPDGTEQSEEDDDK